MYYQKSEQQKVFLLAPSMCYCMCIGCSLLGIVVLALTFSGAVMIPAMDSEGQQHGTRLPLPSFILGLISTLVSILLYVVLTITGIASVQASQLSMRMKLVTAFTLFIVVTIIVHCGISVFEGIVSVIVTPTNAFGAIIMVIGNVFCTAVCCSPCLLSALYYRSLVKADINQSVLPLDDHIPEHQAQQVYASAPAPMYGSGGGYQNPQQPISDYSKGPENYQRV